MSTHDQTVPIGKFKAHCLKLLDLVSKKNARYIITKRGKPIATVIPIEDKEVSIFGAMKGTVTIHGDIISPIDVTWNADE